MSNKGGCAPCQKQRERNAQFSGDANASVRWEWTAPDGSVTVYASLAAARSAAQGRGGTLRATTA